MPTRRQKGDSIQGEKIIFSCRKYIIKKKPVPRTSTHKAQAGTLENAFCTINKQFRLLPKTD